MLAGVVSATNMPALTIMKAGGEQEVYSISLQILALMTALSVLPALLLTMTSFTRIIIVLGILRQAMGMHQTPNNQILVGLGLFLTLFVMAPIFSDINEVAVKPYMAEKIELKEALSNAITPLKKFMINQTRSDDLNTFNEMANGKKNIEANDDIPFSVLIPSFVTSELKTAFQIGFLLFIPFLIIDLVVASVLMSMGMMMLSPLIISLPFKIMLFILVDGWSLVVGTLASSF